jgi:hypothetical protein
MSSAREKTPVMLVIGRAQDAKAGDSLVDAVLTPSSATAPEKDGKGPAWGVTVAAGDSLDAAKLKESGCQLILVESGRAPASVLLDEEVCKGMTVEHGLPDQRIRAIEDSPFEFLVYRPSSISLPLTVEGMIELQELISSFSKHIFLELSEAPGESDLDLLKQMPVSAIVLDLDKVSADTVKSLKESIAKLEPRKQKPERSPLVPLSGRHAVEADADGGGDFDDDDDWDDDE